MLFVKNGSVFWFCFEKMGLFGVGFCKKVKGKYSAGILSYLRQLWANLGSVWQELERI